MKMSESQVCIPSFYKGNRIILVTNSNERLLEVEDYLTKTMSQAGQSEHFTPSSPAEMALATEMPSTIQVNIISFFPKFIAEKFNTQAGYDGPNCYNTALFLSGKVSGVRHVYETEFNFYVENYFKKFINAQSLNFGDIIVYDGASTADHTAFYLFDSLVFHKKGYKNRYAYQITEIHDVYKNDPYEIKPSINDSDYFPSSSETQINREHYYRPITPQVENLDLTLQENKMISTVDFFFNLIQKSDIPNKLGIALENLMKELSKEFKQFESSPNLKVRESYSKIESLYFQVYLKIDKLFSSPFANTEKTTAAQCIFFNDELRNTLTTLRDYFEVDSSSSTIDTLIQELQAAPASDLKTCNISLLKLAKQTE